jgi:hypothetical protein
MHRGRRRVPPPSSAVANPSHDLPGRDGSRRLPQVVHQPAGPLPPDRQHLPPERSIDDAAALAACDQTVQVRLHVVFYVRLSGTGALLARAFGLPLDIPCIPADYDYDGDSRTDIAVVREEGGVLTFYVRKSSDAGLMGQIWGLQNDFPMPGDYDGDGRTACPPCAVLTLTGRETRRSGAGVRAGKLRNGARRG